jgi:hypothetical protein
MRPPRDEGAASTFVEAVRYSLKVVPFRRLDTYLILLGAVVHTVAEIVSPFLMTAAAAPVELPVVPVTSVRYLVPFGHGATTFCDEYFSVAVVVPLPPFQVIFVVRLPVILEMGTVTDDDPPAANAPLQFKNADATVPVPAFRLSDVVDDSFEHVVLDAADAGLANGTASPAAVAIANTSALARIEVLTPTPSPFVVMVFPSNQNDTSG